MRVALNAQLLSTTESYRGAGVSNYCRHLLTALGALAAVPEELTLTAFVNVPDFNTPGISIVRTDLPLQRPLARIFWEQIFFPRAVRQAQADLVHGLVNVLPLATTVPGVVTVHDLSFVRMPETLPMVKRWYLTQLCRASVQRARQVIAVSRQTADDLVHFFEVPAAKITVIPNGVAGHFAPQPPDVITAFRRQQALPERFLLYLGTLEPRKNLLLLIRAYARWQATTATAQAVPLVLAGGKGWFYSEIFQLVRELNLTNLIRFPGFIPDADLALWYNAATAFVYPSRFEGFGLPVLEAMACGTPVICSDIASLREVIGDSALTCAVDDETRLAGLLGEVTESSAIQQDLRRRGLQQAAIFPGRGARRPQHRCI
ncbi:MAG: glycosyltransferase family 1 protein [Caldilineaceae bacterium]